ncbi:hypothetical protein, partial [Arcobacter sp.]|uniref:hypothetical protein n=1 Tax=Arcobacter sp. TaxID=1872629 RepID=UPI003D114D2B
MKSVPNLISYLHKFFRIFIPFLSIFPARETEFRVYFNWKSNCRWGPPGSGTVAACRPRLAKWGGAL